MQTQARNQVSILPILWQSCSACHVAVVYSLAKLSTACQVLRRLCFQLQDDAESLKGSGGMFRASQGLFGSLHITACMLRGHRRDIDHLSAEVVPAAVFLFFVLFGFMIFHVWGLWLSLGTSAQDTYFFLLIRLKRSRAGS